LKASILFIYGQLSEHSDGSSGDQSESLTSSAVRNAAEALCAETDTRLDFRLADDGKQILQWLARDSGNFAGVIVSPGGLPRPVTAAGPPPAGREATPQPTPVIEVHPGNGLHAGSGAALSTNESAWGSGFICGFGLDGYLAAIRSIRSQPAVTGKARVRKRKGLKVYVLNGPNLNLLGYREPKIYGNTTLDELGRHCLEAARQLGLELRFLQSNHEGELVEWIQEAIDAAQGIIINAAAYTHTSIAIHDALRAYAGSKIELHISNPRRREPFRHWSYVAAAVDGIVAVLGTAGYGISLQLMAVMLADGSRKSRTQ